MLLRVDWSTTHVCMCAGELSLVLRKFIASSARERDSGSDGEEEGARQQRAADDDALSGDEEDAEERQGLHVALGRVQQLCEALLRAKVAGEGLHRPCASTSSPTRKGPHP